MSKASETVSAKHRATAKRINQMLAEATNDGTLDELAAFVHPDVINRFCDAISDMVRHEA